MNASSQPPIATGPVSSADPGAGVEAFVACAVCGSATKMAGEKTGHVAPRTFHFRQCPQCYFSFVADPWTDYAAIYDARYYRGEGADPYVDYYFELEHPEESVRRYEWEGIVTAVNSLHRLDKTTCWVDFGCGNGGLVRHVAAQVGCPIVGTDTGEIVAAARAKGIDIRDDAELSFLEGKCDVVTAIEVLEHLPDPLPVLRRIRSLLKPGGLFYYTTGNARPFRKNITGWAYTIPEIHVSFYEPETMTRALRATGFRPETVEPLPGLDRMIRFKILKRLGRRHFASWQNLLPWAVIVPVLRRKLGIGELPIGWAE